MLIVCPSCATSYMIEPASLGAAGRTVRCARCKATWFASPHKQQPGELNAFVDGVIAEAEAQTAGLAKSPRPGANLSLPPSTADDDFGAEPESPIPEPTPAAAPAPIVEAPVPEVAVAPEPIAISDAPSLVPLIEHAPLPETAGAEIDADDIESYAARRERMKERRKLSRRSSRWTAIVLVLFSLNVALIGARDEVVRYLPQTASLFAAIGLPVNLRHLKFENVRISKATQEGVSIMIVEGTVVSDSSKPVTVPRLRFAARNATGQEVYTWTALASRSILGPGEKIDFRSQLASPPVDANDVMVRFFTARDVEAGAK